MAVINVFFRQVFSQPFMLMALVVFIGYMAMKQSFTKALGGAIKASVGILAMGMGSGALISNFNVLLNAVTEATGIQGAGLNTYSAMTAGYEVMDSVLGSGVATTWGIYALLVGFLFNLLWVALRKWTKMRAVYLTGNAMIVQAGISVFIVWKFLNLGMVPTVLIAGFVTSLYWAFFPTLLIKPTHEITGADFTVAHQQMLMDYVAYKVAPKLGDPKKDDIEKMKLPKSLNILQDSVIATALVFIVSTIIIFLIVGGEGISAMRTKFGQGGLTNNVVFLIWVCMTLTANIVVLLYGVRMFVGEIMMSFKGISEKLLPGAVAGVDCAAIYGFAPKSVVLGLIVGCIGQAIGVILLIAFKSPVFLIPGFIPLFFDNATVAIYANKFGGYKAAIIIVLFNSIMQILLSAVCVYLLNISWWQGVGDYCTIWLAVIAVFKGIGAALGIPMAA